MKPLKENSARTLAVIAVLKTLLPKRLTSSSGDAYRWPGPVLGDRAAGPAAGG